jgi:hypothetical protein
MNAISPIRRLILVLVAIAGIVYGTLFVTVADHLAVAFMLWGTTVVLEVILFLLFRSSSQNIGSNSAGKRK